MNEGNALTENDLKSIMDGIQAGRQEPKHDEMFPLHAQWKSFPFGSNEHYAVACALGMGGLSTDPKPVKRTRPFFTELEDAGLIDADGNASQALKDEVKNIKVLNEVFAAGFGK